MADLLSSSRIPGDSPVWGTDRRDAAVLLQIYTDWGWQRIRRFLREEGAVVAAMLREPEIWAEIDALARRLLDAGLPMVKGASECDANERAHEGTGLAHPVRKDQA